MTSTWRWPLARHIMAWSKSDTASESAAAVPRSYYLSLARTETGQAQVKSREVMCVVERGLEEGSPHLSRRQVF